MTKRNTDKKAGIDRTARLATGRRNEFDSSSHDMTGPPLISGKGRVTVSQRDCMLQTRL